MDSADRITEQAKQEYTHKLMQAHLRVGRLAMQLNRIDGSDGKTPLPRGLDYGHVGDLRHLIELLDQAGDVLDEHVNGIVEMRENQVTKGAANEPV